MDRQQRIGSIWSKALLVSILILGVMAMAVVMFCAVSAHAASLLPNGQQSFVDSNGVPLAGGKIYTYFPNTTSPKTTWQNAGQSVANSNPIVLNSAGRAIVYGYGSYRQIVQDANGNTIWDNQTADYQQVLQDGTPLWGGTSTGSSNAYAITLTPAPTQYVAGQTFKFLANFTNTGAATINVNGLGVVNIVEQAGGATLAGDVQGLTTMVYDGSAFRLSATLVLPTATTSVAGIVQLATNAETQAGTNATKAVTPAGMASQLANLVPPSFSQLKITSPGSSKSATVTAGQISMVTTAGLWWSETTVNHTLNCLNVGVVNGLDTGSITSSSWYYVWEISNGVTSGSLASLSASAPTMPSGYTYKSRIGSFRTDGSSNMLAFVQFGRRTQWINTGAGLPTLAHGNSIGTLATPVYVAVPVGNFVPTTASRIQLSLMVPIGINEAVVAPNNNYGKADLATSQTNLSPPVLIYSYSLSGTQSATNNLLFDMTLEGTNVYWMVNSGATDSWLVALGYEDNL